MVLKGIIELVIDNYTVKVRIPEYHKLKDTSNATSTDNLPEAIVSVMPGISVSLQVNDIVLVEFENDQINKPVVIGTLFRESGTLSEADAVVGSLKVTSSAVLPKNTTIGNITAERLDTISFLIDQIADSQSGALLRRINHLDNSLALNYDPTKKYYYSELIENCSFVIYDSQLYRCKENTGGTPEEPVQFDETKWLVINVSNEFKSVWTEIREIKAGGRIKIGEIIVDIPATSWILITSREEYYAEIVLLSQAGSIPNISKVICSYDTESGELTEIDDRREEWLDKDVYLQSHKVESANVKLTFIANQGKPTIDLKARLLILIDTDPDAFNGITPAYINAEDPKDKYKADTYIWINLEENTLSYRYNNGTLKQLGNNIDIYYLTVSGSEGWEQSAAEGDYFYPQHFKKFITSIPLSKHPKANTEIYPLIQPLSRNSATSASAWVASKRQCFIDKVVKDESTSSEYFVAFVYCENVFTDDAKDAISFLLFDFGKDDGV